MKRENKPEEKAVEKISRAKDKIVRKHRKTILLNDKELEALEFYCKKYKVKSQTKFFREVIVSTILRRFEEDHPKLF